MMDSLKFKPANLSMYVLGFDLSLTSPAAVALPRDWYPGDWGKVLTWGLKPEKPPEGDLARQYGRYIEIANWAVAIVRELQLASQVHVFIEGYALSLRSASSSGLMESGGVVRIDLFRECALAARTISVFPIRELLLGKVPREAPKVAVQAALARAGAPKSWGEDVCDAFAVANYGLSEVGGTALLAHPVASEKVTKRKRAG